MSAVAVQARDWGPHSIGTLVATNGALDRATQHGISLRDLLARHTSGDWGDSLDDHDVGENERSLVTGARVLSSYGEGDKKLWIITDAEGPGGIRRVTTILCPEDY